jgi:hypothetical protein
MLLWLRLLSFTEPQALAIGAALLFLTFFGAGALVMWTELSRSTAPKLPPHVRDIFQEPTTITLPSADPGALPPGDSAAASKDQVPASAPVEAKPDLAKLRDIMDRGVATFGSAQTDEERLKGAELVFSAASQGFKPARDLVVHNYPRSRAVRRVVPVAGVVRFAIEPLASNTLEAKDNKQRFVILATYFSIRGLIKTFATELVNAVRDDKGLQMPERLDTLLGLLSGTRGTCTAILHIVSQSQAIEDPECSPEVRDRMLSYVNERVVHDPERARAPALPQSQAPIDARR